MKSNRYSLLIRVILNRFKTGLGVLYLLMQIPFCSNAQTSSGFIGHRYFISIGKDLNIDLLSADGEDYSIRSRYQPVIKIEKIMRKRSMIGFSYTSGGYTFTDKHYYYGLSNNVALLVNDQLIGAEYGTGEYVARSNMILFHFKKYNRNHSFSPFGRFISWDFGMAKTKVTVKSGYKVEDYQGDEFIFNSNLSSSFSSLVLGLNFGRAYPFLNKRMVFGGSLGICFKPCITTFDENKMYRFCYDASDQIFYGQILNLKFSLSYAL